MDFKKLLETDDDERAVSPVIGVILMVAITVILAAVIGAFVIGIGDDQEVQPTASFNFDFDTDTNNVTVSHSQGDTIDQPDSLYISVDGDRVEWNDSSSTVDDGSSTGGFTSYPAGTYPVNSGKQVTGKLGGGFSGQTVSVVWVSESGDSSGTLSTQEAPN